jgi:hypothetical protein
MMQAQLIKQTDSRTFGQLIYDGLVSELSYMTTEQAVDAIALEAELTAAAKTEPVDFS